jgi:hypothetical protein
MRRLPARFALLVPFLGLLLVSGCGSDKATTPANQPPVVSLTEFPAAGSTVTMKATFRWSGTDVDGSVADYQYALDSETDLTTTADTTVTFNFTKDDGTESMPQDHVFRVRAVDDRDLAGLFVTLAFRVAFPNDRPVVAFSQIPNTGGYVGPLVTITWRGEDADGNIDHYEYVLEDTLAAWTSVADTMVTLDFSSGVPAPGGRTGLVPRVGMSPLNITHDYVFYLRAIDNEGKASDVIHTGFTSGPANVPPTVTLTSLPTATVTGTATWVWQGIDPDGEITRYEWAIDMTSDADWHVVGATTDSLTRVFTRADGTAEEPVDHFFYLRARDDDGAYSDTQSRKFTVGVPNQAPTVNLTQAPQEGGIVSFRSTIKWSGTDDEGIVSYEYAVDGSATWTTVPVTVTSRDFVFSCTDSVVVFPSPNPTAPQAQAFGFHRFAIRATDAHGAVSATVSVSFRTVTITPYTTIVVPTPGNGMVTGGTSFDTRWMGVDVDRNEPGDPGNRTPQNFDILWSEVPADSTYADGAGEVAAALARGAAWQTPADGTVTHTFTFESGKEYAVAVRARDVSGAVEPYYHYGRNVLRVTVP